MLIISQHIGGVHMHPARVIITLSILIITSILPAISSPGEGSAIVNLMINVESHSDPDQVNETHQSLVNLMNEVDGRNLNATLFISEEAVKADRLYLTFLGNSPNHEMSVVRSTDSKSISKDDIEDAKEAVESCHVCGSNTAEANGFFCQPPEAGDISRLLGDAGMAYHAGYQAGVIYAPGHEKDSWPYPLREDGVYAVPISSYDVSGKKVPLLDRSARDLGMSGDEWYAALEGRFEESAGSGEPMVTSFNNLVSGTNEAYLSAFVKFLDYATSRNATFVTTMGLVNLSAARNPEAVEIDDPAPPEDEEGAEEDCEECDSVKGVTIAETNETKSDDSLAMPVPVMTE